jgi:glycosyltransferase involved in cell wall biosynthesis
MRIAMVVHQFLPRFSFGTEVLTLELARELQARGHDVVVLTTEPTTPEEVHRRGDWYRLDYEDVRVYRINHSWDALRHPLRSEYRNRGAAAKTRRLLERLQPDIVHIQHASGHSAAIVDACSACAIPVVFGATDFWTVCRNSLLRRNDGAMCRGPNGAVSNCLKCQLTAGRPASHRGRLDSMPTWAFWMLALAMRFAPIWQMLARLGEFVLWSGLIRRRTPPGPVERAAKSPFEWLSGQRAIIERPRYMRKMLRQCERIVAPTALMRDMLIRNGAPAQRIRLVPFGLNLATTGTPTEKTPATALRIGYVGQIVLHKGLEVLADAMTQLRGEALARPIELRVWGDLNQQPAYSQAVLAKVGGDSAIRFEGTFPNERIGEIFADLDVLVVPSLWYENTPLVVLSALATRTPVVATDLGGLSAVITHGVNGLLFPLGDAAALAAQIRRLVDEPELLPRLRDGIGPVKSHHAYAAELETIYQEVVGADSQRPTECEAA